MSEHSNDPIAPETLPAPPALTGAQRQKLRGRAHALEPVVLVGHSGVTDAVIKAVREASKAAASTDTFKTAIGNLGDTLSYLDQPEFAKFWDVDAKRVEDAVRSIGKVEG